MYLVNHSFLPELGKNIKKLRKKYYPQDDQKSFAFRIKVSRATFQKMEKGDLTVSIKNYYAVAELLDMQDVFINLFNEDKKSVNLIEELNL